MSREAVMKLDKYLIAFLLVAAVPSFCQTEASVPAATPAQSETPAQDEDQSLFRSEPPSPVTNSGLDEMQVPAPVSTASHSMEFASETPRSNYLSGGLTFMGTYDDNIG